MLQGAGRRTRFPRIVRAGVITLMLSVCLVVIPMARSGASAATSFTAVGSVEQVDVTGLAAGTAASLISPDGTTFATQNANSLGGLLFRTVPPGEGYVVRDAAGDQSPPLVVHNQDPAPWDPGIYNQSIPAGGYTYLTNRDGTSLAIDVHVPTSPASEPGPPPGTP